MIRIRFKNTINTTKEIYGYPYTKEIVFYVKDDKYTITLQNSLIVEKLLNQACEQGFINFDKEEIEEYSID